MNANCWGRGHRALLVVVLLLCFISFAWFHLATYGTSACHFVSLSLIRANMEGGNTRLAVVQ